MTIRKKLIIGFTVLFVLGTILGIVGLVSVSQIAKRSSEQQEMQDASQSIANVLTAHYTWRQSLTEAVFLDKDFTGSLDSNNCALGKWRNEEEQNVEDEQILSLLSKVTEPHTFIHNKAADIVELLNGGKREEAAAILTQDVLPKAVETIDIISGITERYTELIQNKINEIKRLEETVLLLTVVMIILNALLSVIIAILIIKSIMNPIRSVTAAANTIAKGDLDISLHYSVKDEIGELVTSMQDLAANTKSLIDISERIADGDLTTNVVPRSEKDSLSISMSGMIHNLTQMFIDINKATMQVSTASKQIADGSQVLAQGATEQAATVEQLSASISQVSQKTDNNAKMAKEAAQLSLTIQENAEKGSLQMGQMMQAVKEINDASDSIGKVIKVIEDIAFQTNILALNAAVEAARAGEYGKGFAVVADEVRKLAIKSAEAAKDTGTLIEKSIEKASFGYQIATQTSESLQSIVEGIKKSSALVGDIAASSDAQANAVSQINSGIDQVSQVVQQNSATAQESAASSEEMSSQSIMLRELISRFKLRNGGTDESESSLTSPVFDVELASLPTNGNDVKY